MDPVFKQLQMFIEFAAKELGLKEIPTIFFAGDKENQFNAFGHTKGDDITVRVTDRHPGDVMRTIAHELVHYLKNNYPNESVKDEDEANALAGRIMRKYNLKTPKVFKMKPIDGDVVKEDGAVAVNSVAGGGVANFDPMLNTGKQPMKRKALNDIIGPRANRKRRDR